MSPRCLASVLRAEHSVLCGSRKYTTKEPFVELLKGSLQTFLNAFTYPDRTCYPVASCNLKDFYNLVNVYLDAGDVLPSPPLARVLSTLCSLRAPTQINGTSWCMGWNCSTKQLLCRRHDQTIHNHQGETPSDDFMR